MIGDINKTYLTVLFIGPRDLDHILSNYNCIYGTCTYCILHPHTSSYLFYYNYQSKHYRDFEWLLF